MNATDIELALANGPFHFRRYVCVPNLNWGLLPHEADLAALAPSGYLYEIEIKITVADLRRDALKAKHRRWPHKQIRGFWYAMPALVWEKVAESPPIPEYAGVIVINHTAITYDQTKTIRKPHLHRGARQLSDRERAEMGRLGMMRYWSRDNSPARRRYAAPRPLQRDLLEPELAELEA